MDSQSISIPPSGERRVVALGPEQQAVFDFALRDADSSRQGDDLVLSFPGGGVLVIEGYFAAHNALLFTDGPFTGLHALDGLDTGSPVPGTDMTRGEEANGEEGESGMTGENGESALSHASAAGNASPEHSSPDSSGSGTEASAHSASPGVSHARGHGQGGDTAEVHFNLWNDSPLYEGIDRTPGLDLGWTFQNVHNEHEGGAGTGAAAAGDKADLWGDSSAPNSAPEILALSGDGATLKERGVRGDDMPLGLAGANEPVEGQASLSGRVIASDRDNDALSFSVAAGGASGSTVNTVYGSVSIGPDGAYTYTLDQSATNALAQGEKVEDRFTVTVSDGRGGTAEREITVAIEGTNDAPVLDFSMGDGTHTLGARHTGDVVRGALSVTDPDSDGAPGQDVNGRPSQQFSISAGSSTTGTLAQHADGSATFTTGKGALTVHADGSYTFEYSGPGVSADETLNFVVTTTDAHGSVSNEQAVTVTLTPNRDPVIISMEHNHAVREAGVMDGGYSSEAGVPEVLGRVEAEDADDDSLTYTLTGSGAGIYGTLTLNPDGSYSYALDNTRSAVQELTPGETRTESFTVRVSDGYGGETDQTITVIVTGTNDRPVLEIAGGGMHTGLADGGAASAGGSFTVTDVDADGGWIAGTGNANHAYEIFAGADTSGTAGNGGLGGSSTFTSEYGTLTVNPDGSYSYSLNTASAKLLALGATQTHTDEFVLRVVDKHGAWSEQIIRVEINGKGDPPKISVSGATGTHPLEEAGVTAHTNTDETGIPTAGGSLSAEHVDLDQMGQDISFSLAGTVFINDVPNTLTPGPNGWTVQTAYGTLTLTPTGRTGDGKYGCTYTFALDNDAAIVNSLPEGKTVTLRFTVQAADGGGARTEDLIFTITGSNDRPEITAINQPSAVVEDGSPQITSGTVTAVDADAGDSLSYSLVDGSQSTVQILEGAYGRLEIIQGTGEYRYYLNNGKAQSLAEGETGLDRFTVRVTDKWGAYTEETLEIPITGKDDRPVLGGLAATLFEDNHDHASTSLTPAEVTVRGAVHATDADVIDEVMGYKLNGANDNTGATVTGDGSAEHPYTVEGKYGTLVFHADGTYTYTLRDNQSLAVQKLNEGDQLTDSFDITVTTGHSGLNGVADHSSSSSGNLVITIQGSNDNPVIAAPGVLEVNQGDNITPTVSGQLAISDVDDLVATDGSGKITSGNHSFYFEDGAGDKLQSWEGKFGVLTINRLTGEYTYTVNQYAEGLGNGGTEEFTVWVEDAHGGRASQVIKVALGPLTAPPLGPGPGYTLTGPDLAVTEDDFLPGTTNVQDGNTATLSSGSGPFGFVVEVGGGSRFTQTVSGKYGTITIDDSGHYTYTLNNSLASVQSLRQGATLEESFQLWGTGSGAIKVTITGTNDQPEISLDDPTLALTQRDGTAISAEGTASVADIDTGDNHTFWLDAAGTSKEAFYAFTFTGGKITGFTRLAGASGADYKVAIDNSGKYVLTYLAGGKHLNADDTTDVTFEVFAKDDSGATNAVSDAQTVTVTITGTNAEPVWGTLGGKSVTEDAFPGGDISKNITCEGVFLVDGGVTDDTGNTADSGLFFSISGTSSLLKGQYGTLLITDARTGAYTYTLDNRLDAVQALGVGETLTESFTIRVTDKHGGWSDTVFTVTVNGTNDAPTLDALKTLDLQAVANSSELIYDSAMVLGHDVDAHDTITYSFSYEAGKNPGLDYRDYGTFTLDQNTGNYVFTLDNSKEAVKNLSDSDSRDLHFTITVTDAHGASASQDLTVHIKGVNDAPEIIQGKESLLDNMSHSGDFDNLIQDPDIVKGTTDHQQLTFSASHANGGNGTDIIGDYGTLHINDDGTYSYTPNASGPVYNESFTLHARDPNGATLDVDITFKNTDGDAPSPLSLSQDMTEGLEDDMLLFGDLSAEHSAEPTADPSVGPFADSAALSDASFLHGLEGLVDELDDAPAPLDSLLAAAEVAGAAPQTSVPATFGSEAGGISGTEIPPGDIFPESFSEDFTLSADLAAAQHELEHGQGF